MAGGVQLMEAIFKNISKSYQLNDKENLNSNLLQMFE